MRAKKEVIPTYIKRIMNKLFPSIVVLLCPTWISLREQSNLELKYVEIKLFLPLQTF